MVGNRLKNSERLLGQLIEHAKGTNKRLEAIESELKSLSQFRWKIVGISGCVLVAIEIFFEIANGRIL
jgi:hypothetical protein